MKILICPDKFKESLPARSVANHIHEGILKVLPEAICKAIPLADGGEGTVEAMVAATNGRIEMVTVHDPLMKIVGSFYGISGDGKTAFIEMAAASGMALLKPEERNPMVTSSFGTGELILEAMGKGCYEIILGIGGSATVDGGVGMAQALGIKFIDASGNEAGLGGGNLDKIEEIDISALDRRMERCRITVACDVTNVLTGPEGAAHVFGPQKGASPSAVDILDRNLKHLSDIIKQQLKIDVSRLKGGGAAGGMGAGMAAFLKAELRNGFDVIATFVELEKWIAWADLVITGEGKMDRQTAFGKTPSGVAQLASRHHKPVIGFAGSLGDGADHLHQLGFAAIIPISDRPMSLEQSLSNAGKLLEDAAERTMRLLTLNI
jgi:glycerate kinase